MSYQPGFVGFSCCIGAVNCYSPEKISSDVLSGVLFCFNVAIILWTGLSMDDLSIAMKRTISGGACNSGRDMVKVGR
jgi:hypothetical protein